MKSSTPSASSCNFCMTSSLFLPLQLVSLLSAKVNALECFTHCSRSAPYTVNMMGYVGREKIRNDFLQRKNISAYFLPKESSTIGISCKCFFKFLDFSLLFLWFGSIFLQAVWIRKKTLIDVFCVKIAR